MYILVIIKRSTIIREAQHKSDSKLSGKPERKCSICGKGHLTIKFYKNPIESKHIVRK